MTSKLIQSALLTSAILTISAFNASYSYAEKADTEICSTKRDPWCEVYIHAYNILVDRVSQFVDGTDRPTYPLSHSLKEKLAPSFPNLDLDNLTFGYSNHLPSSFSLAISFCNVTYFNSARQAERLPAGQVESMSWLTHELRHLEQAAELGCDEFAYRYMKGIHDVLGDTALDFFMSPSFDGLSAFHWRIIHDEHLMEIDANYRRDRYIATAYHDQVPLVGDFDGDGHDEAAIWQPDTGKWWGKGVDAWQYLFSNRKGGLRGDIPLVGDFDGDGIDDLAVWRPSNGHWYAIRIDGSLIFRGIEWGISTDIPLVGDVDGDYRDDLIIWAPASGQWHAMDADGIPIFHSMNWGQMGDIPLVGDFDGDDIDDLAIYRPSNGYWYAKRSDGTVVFHSIQWGGKKTAADVPLVGDFDGDNIDDLGIWRKLEHLWFARRADGSVIFRNIELGLDADVPLVGDFSGNYEDDLIIWHPDNQHWHAKQRGGSVLFEDYQLF